MFVDSVKTNKHIFKISEAIFITACIMHNHDEWKRTEQNLFVHSGKSEAEHALDVSYY